MLNRPRISTLPRWLCWKLTPDGDKLNKEPINPVTGKNADCSKPETWCTHAEAVTAVKDGRYGGFGFALGKEVGLVIVDFDHCRNKETGEIAEWAMREIRALNSYTEVSISETGIHTLVWGSIPCNYNKRGGGEIYDCDKMFCLTGKILNGYKTIEERDVSDIHRRIGEKLVRPPAANVIHTGIVVHAPRSPEERALRFEKLSKGDISDYGNDHSAAMAAFVGFLVMKLEGDEEKVDKAVRESAMFFGKWQDGKWDRVGEGETTRAIKWWEDHGKPPFERQSVWDKEVVDTSQKPKTVRPFTDMGNAERLIEIYGDAFRHTTARGWYAWDGQRWAPEGQPAVMRAAMTSARRIKEEAELDGQDDDMKKAINKWARASEARTKLEATVGLAKSAGKIAVSVTEFDQNDWLFNVQNGTVDLTNGKLLPHTRDHLITSLAPVDYAPDAECPQWNTFLSRAMDGDQEMVDFLARAVGYTLTGSNREQCFFINFGGGANGKSTFMETVKHIMGSYGVTTPMQTFQDKKNPGIPNDLAALRSARLVLASEAERTNKLAESLVKQLTGGEAIAARFLHSEFFEFVPKFKIWLGTNHRPQIVGTDDGIWRRVNLIKWGVTIPKEERDRDLGKKLMAEAPGILRWALKGLEQYRLDGLAVPAKVREATTEYRDQEDSLGRFLEEVCEVGVGETSAAELYQQYRVWCESGRERAWKQILFKTEMDKKGYAQKRKTKGLVYPGISIRTH